MIKAMKAIFFGLGSIGRKHVEILKKNFPEIKLVAYRSGVKLSRIEGVTNIYALTDIDFSSFDIAFICNPTNLHYSTAIYCLDKGIKNIFIEKPLSHNLEDLDELLIYANKGRNIYVGHNLRFNETLLKLKEILDENKEIKNSIFYVDVVHSAYMPSWRTRIDYKNSYSASKEKGGGVILDMSHEFDYVRWLFGGFNVSACRYGKISPLEITSEDYCDLFIDIAGIKGRIHLDYFGQKTQRYIDIFYDLGQIRANLIKEKIEVFKSDGVDTYRFNSLVPDEKGTNTSMNRSYEAQMEYFINSIKENRQISNLRENVLLMEDITKIKNMSK